MTMPSKPTSPLQTELPATEIKGIAVCHRTNALVTPVVVWSCDLTASYFSIERQLICLHDLNAPVEDLAQIRTALVLGQQVLRSISA